MKRRFLVAGVPSASAAVVPWVAGVGLAAAAVLVAPGSAVAATLSAPGAHQGVHHLAKKRADPAITIGTCTFNVAGTTLTLAADCTTTATIPVPDGDTLDGAGHTIFARDPAGGLFSGAVVGNAGPVMSVKDLTIDGEFGPPPAHGHCPDNPPLWGVSYSNASGYLSNVRMVGMTRHGTCGIGFGIRIAAEDSAGHQAITITGCSASDFQRGGLLAAGNATVDVVHSTFGPPDPNDGPDDAFGVTVEDTFTAAVPGFTWTCSASRPPSRCPDASGTGPLGGHSVDVAAGGAVTFTLTGILPVTSSGQVVNHVSVIPAPGATSPGCTPECSASVTVAVIPALPVTGPDLLPEAAGGTGLVGLGGLILILLAAWRRKPQG